MGTGANRRADLSLAYVESIGVQDPAAAVEFHFTRAGADGQPGNRGLAGYSDRIRRTDKRTSAAAAGQADEWFLTGAGATWVGNRTFTMGGLTEAEEALLGGIVQGALVTLYQSADGWADYTLRSAVAFVGAGMSRRADLSLAYVESIGVQDPAAAVEFHFTRAGADGLPGNRGLSGYSHSLRRTDKRASAAAASQANEWFLTGAGATWVGNRTLSLGGITEAEEPLLERLGDGALVTVYQGAGQWADYTLGGLVAFVGTGPNRRADLSLVYVESLGAQDETQAVAFHFTAAGVPAPRLGLTLYQSANSRGLRIGGGGSKEGIAAIMDVAAPIRDFSSLIVTAYGQPRGLWGSTSIEVPTNAIPEHDETPPPGTPWWVQEEGETYLRLYFAEGRDAHEATQAYLNVASAQRLHWRRAGPEKRVRILQVLGIAGGAEPDAAVGSATITEFSDGTVTSTRTEYAYIRAASAPTAPAGGGSTYQHAPTGWTFATSSTSPLTATATQDVYRVSRVATFSSATQSSGTFTSAAAWGSVTKVLDRTGPTTVTRTEYAYIRGVTVPDLPTGGASTYQHSPTGWTFSTSSTNPLSPTQTENVYRVQRTATFAVGGFSAANFQQATAWSTRHPRRKRNGLDRVDSHRVRLHPRRERSGCARRRRIDLSALACRVDLCHFVELSPHRDDHPGRVPGAPGCDVFLRHTVFEHLHLGHRLGQRHQGGRPRRYRGTGRAHQRQGGVGRRYRGYSGCGGALELRWWMGDGHLTTLPACSCQYAHAGQGGMGRAGRKPAHYYSQKHGELGRRRHPLRGEGGDV